MTILITGATGGIGRAAAEVLADGGARVLVHGRSEERVRALVESLRNRGAQASGLVADLSSLQEAAELARAAREASGGSLAVLINNAGIGFGEDRKRREVSRDGFELRFAINYLAPFVLTRALLAQGAPTRAIVNVASAGQQALVLDDLQGTRDYEGVQAYRRSKLALIMFTLDLAEELRAISVNALHPGTFLDTAMVREAGIRPRGPASRGAEVILHVLTAGLRGQSSGIYFDETRATQADPQAYDTGIRRALRQETLEMIRRVLPD